MGLGRPYRMYSIYKFVEVNVRPFSATLSHLLSTTWSIIRIRFGSDTMASADFLPHHSVVRISPGNCIFFLSITA